MTAADAEWDLVRCQRLDLADVLAEIDGTAWDVRSLCSGWRVRDVVAHVVGNAEGAFLPRRALPGLIRHRFNVDVFLDHDARTRGAAQPSELLGRLRESADGRHLPPGRRPADVLADAVVHTQDALRPLGIDHHASPKTVLLALRQSVPQGPPLRTKQRAVGLRLRATDIDWAWGDGDEVAGPAEALLLALTGRGAALAQLAGAGVPALAQRCSPPVGLPS